MKEREKINAQKEKDGDDDLLETEGDEFTQAVIHRCEDRLEGVKQDHQNMDDYAARVKKANEERIAKRENEDKAAKEKKKADDNKWKRGTDKRVAGWQTFQKNIDAKRFKAESWGKVGQVGAGDRHHKREQKTDLQKEAEEANIRDGKQERRQAGKDDTWKKGWR